MNDFTIAARALLDNRVKMVKGERGKKGKMKYTPRKSGHGQTPRCVSVGGPTRTERSAADRNTTNDGGDSSARSHHTQQPVAFGAVRATIGLLACFGSYPISPYYKERDDEAVY